MTLSPDTAVEGGVLGVADVLDRAADEIEARGWHQGDWIEDDTGCVCAEGALYFAGASAKLVAVSISPTGKLFRDHIGESIVDWNDAPERTQAEVVAALRSAATAARAGGAK